MNQQAFDWAIIHSDALAMMRSFNVPVRAKVITFSASNRRADLFLDRRQIVSQIPGWSGPLLDLDECQIQGSHNAENLMAALAVGRVLRIPLERVIAALKQMPVPVHRCQSLKGVDDVTFVNDGKSSNLDALRRAITSIPPSTEDKPNIWLIAGGRDKGAEYFDIGPLLSHRVKGAFLFGETQEKMCAVWDVFVPCSVVPSLRQAVMHALEAAKPGDVILFSPACGPLGGDESYEVRSEMFTNIVNGLREARKSTKYAKEMKGSVAQKI